MSTDEVTYDETKPHGYGIFQNGTCVVVERTWLAANDELQFLKRINEIHDRNDCIELRELYLRPNR